MRTIVAVTVCVFFGIVLGVLIARAYFAGKILDIAKQQEETLRENERLTAELQFAAERLRYLENDYASLQKQIDALVSAHPDSRQSGLTTVSGATGQIPEVQEVSPQADATQQASVAPQSNSGRPEPTYMEKRIEEDRVRVQDFIQTQIETSTDPAEQARLSRLKQDMENVRDLLDQLRNAQVAEERQEIIRQVARARAEMKDIILEQRAALVRQTLEQAGVNDAAQQQHIIAALEELQNSPYYNDPMLMWGMAPQPRPAQ